MKKSILLLLISSWSITLAAQTPIAFTDISYWATAQLSRYVGQIVKFEQPIYICNNYYSNPSASMRRIMSPTNQEWPGSMQYTNMLTLDKTATFTLNNYPKHSGVVRMGEKVYGMVAKINSTTSVQFISCDSITGTREDLQRLPNVDIKGKHNLLVCTMNLEYYLTEQFGSGTSSTMGPANASEHQKQRTKTSSALAKINADIYGLVEIQQGQGAIAEVAADLTRLTGRRFEYINDGTSANGTYTKSGYVYCSDVVEPLGAIKHNNAVVINRKKMQAFRLKSTGEVFIFSLNHFKAKSGAANATGANADQGDGQGIFNYSRTQEAISVLEAYNTNKSFYNDDDILIMGDLNAYAKEDPIRTLMEDGMTDLHRYFHADSSYSYVFRGQAGYLDHALCNETMLRQITGMAAYHINSDESDNYTYDKSNDATMFRSSDHDPVLVGLQLGAAFETNDQPIESETEIEVFASAEGVIHIANAPGGYYTIHDMAGYCHDQNAITSLLTTSQVSLPTGFYIVRVYHHNIVEARKVMVY